MSAIITLTDVDGSIGVDVIYQGGFVKESHAHQHALLILKWMDEYMTKLEEPTIVQGEAE